jgi:hypothetical protein
MRLDISPENISIRSNIYGQNIQNTFLNLETDSAREVKSNHEISVLENKLGTNDLSTNDILKESKKKYKSI